MKRKLILPVILLLSVVIYTGCKKDDSPKSFIDKEITQKVTAWLNTQKIASQPNKSKNIDLLLNNLDFNKASYEQTNTGDQILIIPVMEDLKVKKEIDVKSAVDLVLTFDNQKNIAKGNIVIYTLGNGARSNIPANTFHSIYSGLSPGCNGLFKFLSVTGRSIYQLEYKDKKLSSVGIVKPKLKDGTRENGTSGISSFQCYDWYLILTFWVDGIAVGQSATYLGTTCEGGGGCDNSIYETICPDGGSGGGGGGGDAPANCEIPDMTAGVESVSEQISSHVTDINGITKNKNPEWKILKALTWSLVSHEIGTIEHVNYPVDRWEWRTLTHGSISFTGLSVGGTISYSQGVGTTSFTPGTPNVLYAGMSLSFTVTYSAVCNCPGVNTFLPPITVPYTANQLWDANPI
jgi:hypothetical protein